MPQKGFTPQEFFDRCRKVHGEDAYDYSNAVYLSTKKKVTNIRCKHCGHTFDMIGRDHLYNKQGCPNCAHERHANKISLTFENFISKAIKVHGTEKYEYLDYQKDKSRNKHIVTIKCKKCGTIFTLVASEHLASECCCPNECFYTEKDRLIVKRSSHKMTKERFIIESKEYFGDKYDYSEVGEVNSTKMKVMLICKNCGHRFLVKVGSHLYAHRGCPNCAKNVNRKTKEQFIKELNELYRDKFDYQYLVYKNVYEPVHLVCKDCGMHIYQTPSNLLLGNGHHCTQDNMSIGEESVMNALKELGVDYAYQYSISNDTGLSSNKRFDVDFYIQDYNLFIEFNGKQHYVPVNKFGGLKKFELLQKRDNALRIYCRNHNIELLEIMYNEHNKIKELIQEKLEEIKK